MSIIDGGAGDNYTNIFIESEHRGDGIDTHFTFIIERNEATLPNSEYVGHEWVMIPAHRDEIVYHTFTVTSVHKLHQF